MVAPVAPEVSTRIEISMDDPFHLERFVEAQRSCYGQVRLELQAGRKQTHWMWFIFPQIRGLGSSPTARHFAIASLAEAAAYLEHPVLGARLLECTGLVLAAAAASAEEIFGGIDSLKFRSSMTLFAAARPQHRVFAQALERFFDGREDRLTLDRIAAPPKA